MVDEPHQEAVNVTGSQQPDEQEHGRLLKRESAIEAASDPSAKPPIDPYELASPLSSLGKYYWIDRSRTTLRKPHAKAVEITASHQLLEFASFACSFAQEWKVSRSAADVDSLRSGKFRVRVARRTRYKAPDPSPQPDNVTHLRVKRSGPDPNPNQDHLSKVGPDPEPEDLANLVVEPENPEWPRLDVCEWSRFRMMMTMRQDRSSDSENLDGLVVLNNFNHTFTYTIRSLKEWSNLTAAGRPDRVDDLTKPVDFDALRGPTSGRAPLRPQQAVS